MSNEVKIGLLAAFCIAITVWGYKFLKGKNLLNASNYYYVAYENVDELAATSPVLIRGLNVGTVAAVKLSDDMKSIIATLDIDRDIKLHKETEAIIISTGLMGGKAVVLKVDESCQDDECASRGDYLQGRVQGIFESMFADSDIDKYVEKVKEGVSDIMDTVADSLTSPEAKSNVAKSFKDIQMTLNNLASITSTLNRSIDSYDRKVGSVLTNLESMTKNIADNEQEISNTLNNLEVLTTQLKDANIGQKLEKTEGTIESAQSAIHALENTLTEAQHAFSGINGLLADAKAGKGSLGKLMKDEELYSQILVTTKNLELLLQDIRLNPKRYTSILRKKQKEYVNPEEDPAFPNKN